jgi:hypothetical protein
MASHVFISHGSENRDEADALCAFIEARGVRAWIAPRDVRPGVDYSEALQAAIETCDAFVVLVTDMANKSPYVRAETEMAFSCHKPIYPVRLSDIAPAAGLALFLKIRHWTDAYGKGRDSNLGRLALELQTVSGVAPVPAAAPAPPPVSAPVPAPVPAPAPKAPADPDRLAAAIGPKADWYIERWRQIDASGSKIQWNWAACFASIFWFAYRKMWVPVAALALFFAGLNALGLVSPALGKVGLLLSIAVTMVTGALGTHAYRRHVGKLVAEAGGLDQAAALARLKSKGGVSRQAVLVTAAAAMAAAAAMVLVAFIQVRNEQLRNEQLRNEEQADRMRAMMDSAPPAAPSSAVDEGGTPALQQPAEPDQQPQPEPELPQAEQPQPETE